RHYPIVLSEPAGRVKVRLLSNGSAINALARQPNWRGETGTPITIRVGQDRATFGEYLRHLDGPKYERGYLPIVHLRYHHNDESFQEEVFASCDPKLAANGAVFVKFIAINPTSGRLECQIE